MGAKVEPAVWRNPWLIADRAHDKHQSREQERIQVQTTVRLAEPKLNRILFSLVSFSKFRGREKLALSTQQLLKTTAHQSAQYLALAGWIPVE